MGYTLEELMALSRQPDSLQSQMQRVLSTASAYEVKADPTATPVHRPWVPKLTAGRHIDVSETTEVTPENYRRWALNQVEEMNAEHKRLYGRRMKNEGVDYVVDQYRQLAGLESEFGVDHRLRAQRETAERNPFAAFAGGMGQTLASFGGSVVGVVAPKTAQGMMDSAEAYYGPSIGAAGTLGELGGIAATLIPAMGTGMAGLSAGWVTSARAATTLTARVAGAQAMVQGFGGSRIATQFERDHGAQIGWGQEFGAAVTHGVVEGLAAYVSARIMMGVGKVMAAAGPGAQAAASEGGEAAAVSYVQRALRAVPGLSKVMAAEGAEEYMTQVVNNAVTKAWNIADPAYTEGALEAGLAGAVLAPFLGGVATHRLSARLKAQQEGRIVPHGMTEQPGAAAPVLYQSDYGKGLIQPIADIRKAEAETGVADFSARGWAQQWVGLDGPQSSQDTVNWGQQEPRETEWEAGTDESVTQVRGERQLLKPKKGTPKETTQWTDPVEDIDPETGDVYETKEIHFDNGDFIVEETLKAVGDRQDPTDYAALDPSDPSNYDPVDETDFDADVPPDDLFTLDEMQVADEAEGGIYAGQPNRAFRGDVGGTEVVVSLRLSPDGTGVYVNWIGEASTAGGKPHALGNAKMRQVIGYLKAVFPRANRVTGEQVGGIRANREGKVSGRETGEIHTRPIRTYRGKKWVQQTIDWDMEPGEVLPGVWMRGNAREGVTFGEGEANWTNEGLLGIRPTEIPPVGETFESISEQEAAKEKYEAGERPAQQVTAPNQVHHLADVEVVGPMGQNSMMKGFWKRNKDKTVTGRLAPGRTATMPTGWGVPPKDGLPPDYGLGQDSPLGYGPQQGFGSGNGVIEDTISPTRYNIARINYGLAEKLNKAEHTIAIRRSDLRRDATRYAKAKNKVFKRRYRNRTDRRAAREHFANLLSNGEFDAAKAMLVDLSESKQEAQQLLNGFDRVEMILAELHADAVAAGIEVGHRERYWPRSVKDYRQLRETMDGYERSIFDEAMDKERQRLKRDVLSPLEEANVYNRVAESFGAQMPSRGRGTRNFKQRRIEQVKREHQHLYHNEDKALGDYIDRTVEAIEVAKLFGRSGRKAKPGDPGAATTEDSIGAYIRGMVDRNEIQPWQAERLVALIRSRYIGGMQSPNRLIRTVRDIGYMITIANPVSALVQLGDVGLSAIDNGLIETMQGFVLAFNPKMARAYHAGIDKASAEFESMQGIGGVLDWFMKASGFEAVDMLGKRTNMNAAMIKWKKILKQDPDGPPIEGTEKYERFRQEWEPYLGKEGLRDAITAIRAGDLNNHNVRLMLGRQVAKLQPTTLLEMPPLYNRVPNGRLWYMLKTFTIKQLNFARQRSIDKMAAGIKTDNYGLITEGAWELYRYVALFGLMNAGTDLLQKLVCGEMVQPDDLPDIALENLLQCAGMSRYMLDKVDSEGPGAAFFMDLIAPPLGWANDPYKDVFKQIPKILDPDDDTGVEDLKTIRNVPVAGKWLYKTFGGGAEWTAKERRARKTKKRTRVRNEAMQAVLDGDWNSARAMIQRYNDERPDDMKPIKMKGIRQSIRNKRRKEREDAA